MICSKCKRDAAQNGPREVRNGWQHADGSELCDGAETRYPRPGDGQCEARASDGGRCKRNGTHWLPTRHEWQTVWVCDGEHAPPHRQRGSGPRSGGAGNDRNAPCACGSGRKAKKCCGVGA